MSERAVSTIAEQLSTNLFNRLTNGPHWGTVNDFKAVLNEEARNILAALKAARIAVVELPEPCGCGKEWMAGEETVFQDSGEVSFVAPHTGSGEAQAVFTKTPDLLAAALLAAHAAAVGARITVEEA